MLLAAFPGACAPRVELKARRFEGKSLTSVRNRSATGGQTKCLDMQLNAYYI